MTLQQNKNLLAGNIRELMHSNRVSMDNLSEGCGVSRSTLANILAGQAYVRYDTLYKIAEFFGVPLHELIAPVPILSFPQEEANGQSGAVRQLAAALLQEIERLRGIKNHRGKERKEYKNDPGFRSVIQEV